MEGKEVRFGIANPALFATVTTDASCGAVNSMHDSFTPLGGMVPMVNILLGEVVFGAGEQNVSAISFGVLRRSAPSTRAIMRSRKVSPGFDVMCTVISSLNTRVPPVTADRSPPASRMTGADSPGMPDSSTDATPSTTSPSPGIIWPADTRTRSCARSMELGTSSTTPDPMNSGTQAATEAGNMVDLDSNPTKLIEIVAIGKQLLMTRGALTTFSIANDVAKNLAIVPAMFAGAFPVLNALNIMQLRTPQSAMLSAIIFNALIIILLIPLALRGVKYRPSSAAAMLQRNLLVYGLGGVVVPFIVIKLIDMVITAVGLA
ncbi:MAG: potassium-transporting ATPase ATP-binding subunit [Acidobacteriaceae bacterium]|jgi:hypothetical protein|nr:potassium-transporting ATPase ATP-binding subunit [Acidobacteriaceae bacterium]